MFIVLFHRVSITLSLVVDIVASVCLSASLLLLPLLLFLFLFLFSFSFVFSVSLFRCQCLCLSPSPSLSSPRKSARRKPHCCLGRVRLFVAEAEQRTKTTSFLRSAYRKAEITHRHVSACVYSPVLAFSSF